MILQQDKIQVFPFGNTRPTDPLARILNEQNIAQLTKRLSIKPSYVISMDDTYVDFIIEGYYFKVNKSELIESSDFDNKPIFARIRLAKINEYNYLCGGDEYVSMLGDGTLESPYILTTGTINQRISTDTEVYFKYEFADKNDKVVIYKNSSFTYSVTDGVVSTDDNDSSKVIIKQYNATTCTIKIQKSPVVNEASVGMIVNTPGLFTGIEFVSEDTTKTDAETYFYLKLFDENHEVSRDSLIVTNTITSFTASHSYDDETRTHTFTIDQTLPKLSGRSYWLVPTTVYLTHGFTVGDILNISFTYQDESVNSKTITSTSFKSINGIDALTDSFIEGTINQLYFKINSNSDTMTVESFVNSAVASWWD